MSDVTDEPMDPALEEWLAEAREEPGEPADLGDVLAGVEGRIGAAEKSKLFWLRSRPTWLRRLVAGGAAAAIVLVAGVLALRPDFGSYPAVPMALALVALSALLGLSVHQALRPLHQPPVSPLARGGLVAATLLSTLLVAILSPHEATSDGVLAHMSGCLFYGLLTGVPVYLVLRLVDRSGRAFGAGANGALLAACAAGLLGNLALQLHCPRRDVGHLMAGHFAVVVLFVGGLGLVHWLTSRRA